MTYYTTSKVRAIVLGSTSDTSLDTFITQEGAYADVDVENDLYAFSGVTPPFSGGDITTDISGLSDWRTAARVFKILAQSSRSDDCMKNYYESLGVKWDDSDGMYKPVGGGVIGRFKATPTTRAKTVSVNTAYRSSPLADE